MVEKCLLFSPVSQWHFMFCEDIICWSFCVFYYGCGCHRISEVSGDSVRGAHRKIDNGH